MSPPDYACAATQFVAVRFWLPPHSGFWAGLLAARLRLEEVNRVWRPDLIVPLDDVSAWLLRGLAESEFASDNLRRLIQISVGSPSGYQACCSRIDFLDLATRMGVQAPASKPVDRATAFATAEAIGYPVMVKVNQTTGGCGVSIARNPAELAEGMKASGASQDRLVQKGRRIMHQVVWRLAGLPATPERIFELQKFIPGVPAMRSVAAWQGCVLAGASFVSECVHPQPFGASTVVRFIEHPGMDRTAKQLVAALGISGFVSFDFVIADEGGEAFVIECNPRVISSTHLGSLFGHDLCGALATQIGWREEPGHASLSSESRIALFPHEIARDPDSLLIRPDFGVLHDVPWDDPKVIAHCYRRLAQLHPGHAAAIGRLLDVESAQNKRAHLVTTDRS